ncbi:MAG: DUF6159 family protein [Pseudomonadota bacterium]
MSFGERRARAAQLLRRALLVLREDKALIILPLFGGIGLLLVFGAIAVLFSVDHQLLSYLQGESTEAEAAYIAFAFCFYFAVYFVVVFFNSALVAAVVDKLNGGRGSVLRGLGLAIVRLPQIVAWVAVSATVGVVLSFLRDRLPLGGGLIALFGGLAWSIATFFVVPVMVVEKVGPVSAIKRSVEILRRTWGEALMAKIGLTVGAAFITVPIALVLMGLIFVLPDQYRMYPIAALVVFCFFGLIIMTTLKMIVLAALYLYAETGKAPSPFNEDQLRAVVQQKGA